MANFYEELNISTAATQEEITRAYKSLAKKYHPDIYAGDKAAGAKKMAAVNAAYDTLSDKEKRELYDRQNNFNQPAMTYYEELGVGMKASAEEINHTYKILARKYHPDLYQGDKEIGAKKMTAINNAYDTLSDKEKREKYDRKLTGNYSVDKPQKKFPLFAVLAAVAVVLAGVIVTLLLLTGAPKYTVTFLYDEHCTLNGTSIQTVKEGESTTAVTATPVSSSYIFVCWEDEEGNIVSSLSIIQLTNVTKNMTVKAVCAEAVPIKYSAGANGSLSGVTSVIRGISRNVTLNANGQALVAKGSIVTVTAIPVAGFEFDYWDDTLSTDAERTDTVNAAVTAKAIFKTAYYTVEFFAGENGSLLVGGISYEDYTRTNLAYNSTLSTITAVADSGYIFVGWQDSETGDIVSTEEVWSETRVTKNISVTAVFAPQPA